MELEIVSYKDLMECVSSKTQEKIKSALFETGIVGVRDVPRFETKSRDYIHAARQFSLLAPGIRQQYAPRRDAGDTEGYELGAEWFRNSQGEWIIDDKKASYYAFVPDQSANKWPREIDLKTPYLALGELIFQTGKKVLDAVGLNQDMGIAHDRLLGYGRMLHYQKEGDTALVNPNWCGSHFDHGVFTGLIPAWYFQEGQEVEEPEEAGLYIVPTNGKEFEKIVANDKSLLLFQVGEFGQLASNDRIRATRHMVKKAQENIERFTFALFYSADNDTVISSKSELTSDARYAGNMRQDGSIRYEQWQTASLARYRAI